MVSCEFQESFLVIFFALFWFLEHFWESLLNCFPAWSTCSLVPKASQLLIFTCQRANKCDKACQFFNFACQKGCQFFNYFSEEFFNLWIFQLCFTFANFKNTWAILENLSRETNNLNFDICKISLRKCKINSAVIDVLNFLNKISKLLF